MPAWIDEIIQEVAQFKNKDFCIICGRKAEIKNPGNIVLERFYWSICSRESCWKQLRKPKKKQKRWTLKIANRLLKKHGLKSKKRYANNWRVAIYNLEKDDRFKNSYQVCGVCAPSKKTILLNTWLVNLGSKHCVKQTMLHEIAHAKIENRQGTRHAHDEYWQEQAKSLGYLYADRYKNNPNIGVYHAL